jgi:hypothetical protein
LRTIFYTSAWIPAEWIKAHGLEPRGVWFAVSSRSNLLPLSAGICAFAQSVVRLAEAQPDAAVIFTTSCDQMRRGFDGLVHGGLSRAFLFNLPATWQSPVACRIYRAEVERLGRFLVELGGHVPAPAELTRILEQFRQARSRLLEAAAHCSARQYAEAIVRFHWDGSLALGEPPVSRLGTHPLPARRATGCAGRDDWFSGSTCGETTVGSLPEHPAPPSDRSVPLALVGGPLPASHFDLLDTIEAAGGRVVLNATEAGERSLVPVFDAERLRVDPLDALVRGYFESSIDVFQRPNTRLYSWLSVRLAERRTRGIVLWHFVGCDLWRAEAQHMREAFGLPVLLLDADEGQSRSPRSAGRIQAFVEALR